MSSHIVFFSTRVEDGTNYARVYARSKDDVRLVFNGDGTISWRDATELSKVSGIPAPRMKIYEPGCSVTKDRADLLKSRLQSDFRDSDWVIEG